MAKAAAAHRSITDGLDLGPIEPLVRDSQIRESKFFAEYLNRLVTGRDMHVIVTAASETGVGKTTLAASLAIIFDQNGWTAEKAAVAMPDEYSSKYDEVDPGSVLLLDEAEKAADARRGMKKESVTLSQDFATKRYQQVFGILTAPSKSWVDKRLGGDAADYWVQALQTDMGRIKGEAKVYRLKTNEHYMEDYTKKTEYIHWPKLDWHPQFIKLDKRKRDLLENKEGSSYIHKDDVAKIKKSVRREAVREREQEIIEEMWGRDYTQKEIGTILGVSGSRISQRLNGD
jgi:hypothetical protein